ncbi:SUF system Fe-S cluster assembly regulator [Micavibrio aeruginosavorus]|uniref:Iron-sulfur cluster regulator IscR n=1 Tax=Micavibrio aeruginosavorus EPB TaxID=349215 RepID=M4VEP5_9BACT|nr:SUF system Fe-S cluster assembly regulator [Micavibrio aeruginosavorus]AGH97862.1 Iron-sulfur cluster regulator IscR [Micavibrio aeruginosavorus EPB]
MIRLSRFTDYAVLMLAELARDEAARASAADLATRTNLAEPTVAKILKILNRAGLVVSTRGATGGYMIARPAHAMTVADIITAVEGPVAITACADGHDDDCSLSGICAMNGRWGEVNAAVRGALESVTLADMMNKKSAVRAGVPAQQQVME